MTQAAQEAVVGAALLTGAQAVAQVPHLTGAHFADARIGQVYDLIVRMVARSEPVDVVTVAAACADERVKVADDELMRWANETPTTAHVDRYAAIVVEGARKRRLRFIGAELAQAASDATKTAAHILGRLQVHVAELADPTGEPVTMEHHVEATLDELARIADGEQVGVTTGFGDLDRALAGGLRPAQLCVIGARPSVGKSALALQLAAHVALDLRRPVLFASLEMRAFELVCRVAAARGRVDLALLTQARLTGEAVDRVSDVLTALTETTMWMDCDASLTVDRVAARARQLRARAGGLGLVVVDYLQLMSGRSGAENRQVEVSEMSRALKVLAGELDVPVVAASQLSRDLERRTDKRPVLADLRESGSIEQDADVVLALHRAEVHDPETADKGVGEVIVAKHRNGPTGVVRLAWLAGHAAFAQAARERDDF